MKIHNDSMIIFSNDVKVENNDNTYVPFQNCSTFWEHCGDDDVKLGQAGCMDPVLRVCRGCRIMLHCNFCVRERQANGTQAIVIKVVLHTAQTPTLVMLDGLMPVPAVKASQVANIPL